MSEQEKRYVEIDAGAWLTETGVEVTVFVGKDSCDPIDVKIQPYEQLVDESIGSYCTHGRLSNKHGYDNIGDAEKTVIALEEAAALARELFESLKDE